jgi:hypothetical protein
VGRSQRQRPANVTAADSGTAKRSAHEPQNFSATTHLSSQHSVERGALPTPGASLHVQRRRLASSATRARSGSTRRGHALQQHSAYRRRAVRSSAAISGGAASTGTRPRRTSPPRTATRRSKLLPAARTSPLLHNPNSIRAKNKLHQRTSTSRRCCSSARGCRLAPASAAAADGTSAGGRGGGDVRGAAACSLEQHQEIHLTVRVLQQQRSGAAQASWCGDVRAGSARAAPAARAGQQGAGQETRQTAKHDSRAVCTCRNISWESAAAGTAVRQARDGGPARPLRRRRAAPGRSPRGLQEMRKQRAKGATTTTGQGARGAADELLQGGAPRAAHEASGATPAAGPRRQATRAQTRAPSALMPKHGVGHSAPQPSLGGRGDRAVFQSDRSSPALVPDAIR